jgi:hypothetical protein
MKAVTSSKAGLVVTHAAASASCSQLYLFTYLRLGFEMFGFSNFIKL